MGATVGVGVAPARRDAVVRGRLGGRRRRCGGRGGERVLHDFAHVGDVDAAGVEPSVALVGVGQVRVERDALQRERLVARQRDERAEHLLRDVGRDAVRGGGGDVLEARDDVGGALLLQHALQEAALAAHAAVVVGVAPRAGEPERLVAVEVLHACGHVAAGPHVPPVGQHAADGQRRRPDVDGDPADRVDDRRQARHVDLDVVVDVDAEHVGDRLVQEVEAGIRGGGGRRVRGVVEPPRVDGVEQVVARQRAGRVVEALGELLGHRGARRELGVADVAG